MSKHATQKVTYHCKNSVAWYDVQTKSYDKSLKLLALNGFEYSQDGPQTSRPKVLRDDCKVGYFICTTSQSLMNSQFY